MAYCILYDDKNQPKKTLSAFRRLVLTVCFFACFLWLVSSFWPEGQELLRRLLIPGDPDGTLHAAEVFAQEIGSSFPLSDAARNFCLAILDHGYSG